MSRPRVLKIFLHLGVASPAVHDVGLRAVDQTGVRFARVLDGVPVSHPDRAAAIDFVFHLIDAELSYRLLHTADDDIDTLDWSDLRHRLTDVVIGYLLSPATESARS